VSELEEIPNSPPDWRDWINEFPTVKSVAIFCLLSWIITPMIMTLIGFLIGNGFFTDKDAIAAVLALTDKWLDALLWLTSGAVLGIVAKRAVTRPEVVRAEGEVKAAATLAAATAATTSPVPIVADDPDAILAAEERARREKHALNPPIAEEG
jgi:hypothetical protein